MSNIPYLSWLSSGDGLEDNPDYEALVRINDLLKEQGYCYVSVLGGDYDGSIAKFTPNATHDGMYYKAYNVGYLIKCYWEGRLSWEGKRNNPSFILRNDTCNILFDYHGPTILKKFDINKAKEELLKTTVEDIDGTVLEIGDNVLYLNLRYGSGGKLCRGEVVEFKPHARQGYLSVIVKGEDGKMSDLNYPHMQVLKL